MFYEGKKVLVAGGTGMIGTHVVKELLQQGGRVRATVHKRPPAFEDKAIEYVQCDLTRAEDCTRVVKDIDFVFMCAAFTFGAGVAVSNPMSMVTPNLLMESQMLEAACLAGVKRYLLMSSTTVYPAVTHPVKEDEAFVGEPHESYFGVGWMKRYIEKLAEFYYKRYQLKIAIVRPPGVYGPHDVFDFEKSHVVPALIMKAVEKQNPFQVWGDGLEVRDLVYVTDLVDGSLIALEKLANCQAVNLGSGEAVTIKDVVNTILKITDQSNTPVVYDVTKPSTIPVRRVEITKARSLLGYNPKVFLSEGLKKTIEWYEKSLSLLKR